MEEDATSPLEPQSRGGNYTIYAIVVVVIDEVLASPRVR